jgi:hypothetical protein
MALVAFGTVINSAQFSHLNPSIFLGIISGRGLLHLFNRRGVQMITVNQVIFRSQRNNGK